MSYLDDARPGFAFGPPRLHIERSPRQRARDLGCSSAMLSDSASEFPSAADHRAYEPSRYCSRVNKRRTDEERMHDILSQRIMNWHQLLWQVPLFAFTAQAFTFTIALDRDSTTFARLAACALSVLISLVSLVSLVRQRKADRLDSKQVAAIEKRWGWKKDSRLHGKAWAVRRRLEPFDGKFLDALVGSWTLTAVWAVAFFALLALAVVIAVVATGWPELLAGSPGSLPLEPTS